MKSFYILWESSDCVVSRVGRILLPHALDDRCGTCSGSRLECPHETSLNGGETENIFSGARLSIRVRTLQGRKGCWMDLFSDCPRECRWGGGVWGGGRRGVEEIVTPLTFSLPPLGNIIPGEYNDDEWYRAVSLQVHVNTNRTDEKRILLDESLNDLWKVLEVGKNSCTSMKNEKKKK